MRRIVFLGLVAAFTVAAILWLRFDLQKQLKPPEVNAAPAPLGSTMALLSPASLPAVIATNASVLPVAISSTAPPVPPELAAFAEWARHYLEKDPSANAVQGEALAWKRRAALLELIQCDPARAIELTVPFEWRVAFPANITRYFEQQIDARGAYEVAMATEGSRSVYRWAVVNGQRYEAFVYGRRPDQPSRTNTPLHGIAVEKKLALSPDPIRTLPMSEAQHRDPTISARTCRVCNRPVNFPVEGLAGEIGGEVAYFCSPEHLSLVNEYWKLAAFGPGETGAELVAGNGATWTTGRKNLLYMRVNFPDDLTEPVSEGEAYRAMDAVNAFYVENSYNTTWLTATVTPLLTLPQVKEWYSTEGPSSLLSDARETARKAGFDAANYDLDLVSHTRVSSFDWAGLGRVGGKGLWLQSFGAGVTAHELGHNYGLPHANFWDTLANFSVIGPGTNQVYGNLFDTMGAASAGDSHFSVPFKNALGWLPKSQIQRITTSGLCRLYPFDAPRRDYGRMYGARITKDFERDYWLEFRQAFTDEPSLQNGILLNWSPWSQSDGGIDLIDTTPETMSHGDAALVAGRTFSDTIAGIHITPLQVSASERDSWIDVQINLGAFPGNTPPQVVVEVTPSNPAPGQQVHFHATATDADHDTLAYSWTFDDETFSIDNRASAFKSWPKAGDHLARCTVSDMKGGIASANVLVTIGQPQGFRITGVVLDENDDPIEGVRVDNGITNFANYVSSITDSDGFFVLTGIKSELTLEATKYGYSFTNRGWENPIPGTNHLTQVNLLATRRPTASLSIGTNVITEGSAVMNRLELNRTGNLDEDMVVLLSVSGTAQVPADLSFNPPLARGMNFITIPAGSNQVAFTFRAVNNTVVEPEEMASITILERTNYIIAPQAEALITVLDDDQPILPVVSIGTENSTIAEAGVDDGVFVLTRTGTVGADLPVFYSVNGSATAGADYATLVGVAVIPAGQSSVKLALRPIDDKDVEGDETVAVTISANATYARGDSSATITIADDDLFMVTLSPTSTGAAEPAVPGRFTIKRDGDQVANLVVYYSVSGTATPGVDYAALSGAATIPGGQTSADIQITPFDDSLTEGDESVILTLVTNPGYDIGTPASAALFIRDNERASVSVLAIDSAASEPGANFGSIRLSRSVTNGNLAVNLQVSGTAIPGADYIPLDPVVIIPDGAASVTLNIIAFDDLHFEPLEDVIVSVAPGTNYDADSSVARVTIEDDDAYSLPAVGFAFAASSAPENESPGLSLLLSETSAVPVTVNYRVIGGTASTNDYVLPPGPIVFEPGVRVQSIPLHINDDLAIEPNETLRIALFDPTNATHDAIRIHTYTIEDNDSASVSVSVQADATEGGVPGAFRITRTGSTNASINVHFQATGTASSPADFPGLGTNVIIPPGAAFVNLPVAAVDDGVVELDESVVLTLTTAPGATISSPARATLTILDNDPNSLPVVSISATNKPFSVEGGGSGEFVFTRSGPITNALAVFVTFTGDAAPGADYQAIANPITLPAGQASVAVPVVPIDDAWVEGDETVTATLTVRDTYRAAHIASATVVLQDNDQTVEVVATDFESAEPGVDRGAFTFTRQGTTNFPVQVFFSIGGTAVNSTDYVAIPNSVIIPAGSLEVTLPLIPLDDALVEGPEQVVLSLQNAPAYVLGASTIAAVTIVDDEPMVRIVAVVTNVVEGSPDPGVMRVERSGDLSQEFTARLAVGGTARYGVDYPPFLTNIFFNCGVASIELQVFPTNELVIETKETVLTSLVPNPAYTILAPSNALIAIEDAGADRAPLISILSPTAQTVFLPGTNANMLIEASVQDDGDSNTPVTITWTNISGPETVRFDSTNTANTAVRFSEGGIYLLRMIADDGRLTNSADLTVVVDAAGRLSTNLLHWSFDDGSGGSVADDSGFNRHGTILGPANWTRQGRFGEALELTGTNNFAFEAAPSQFLNGLRHFSLSFWIKASDTNSDRGILAASDSRVDPTLALFTRAAASCGSAGNVLELTMATTRGSTHRVSAANTVTNGWQHVAITWSNGLAPALFINGGLDQPKKQFAPLRGKLVNNPIFMVGKGPSDVTNTWKGLIDDVVVFPRALDAAEVGALVATNFGALVEVPTNLTVQVILPVAFSGQVTDDSRPLPPGLVSNTWLQVKGPATISIPNSHDLTNFVEFTQAGDYVFRLVADDGQVKTFQDLPVTVVEPTLVNVFASDSEAAELGPDAGEFTFSRVGDLNFDLTIQVMMTGTASNGADFTLISQTNTVVLANGLDSTVVPIVPFLDHRTEGDETITFTILTNLAYTVGSGEATVTIYDSPYGVWNIAHFTLEELTDPSLSGEDVDFDHDGLLNFAEYAANLDPKSSETNSPLTTELELMPDGTRHIVLTYHRWLEPMDVAYEPTVSTDLRTWQTGSQFIQEIGTTPDPNGFTETVKARVVAPWPKAAAQFITVRVRLRSTGP